MLWRTSGRLGCACRWHPPAYSTRTSYNYSRTCRPAWTGRTWPWVRRQAPATPGTPTVWRGCRAGCPARRTGGTGPAVAGCSAAGTCGSAGRPSRAAHRALGGPGGWWQAARRGGVWRAPRQWSPGACGGRACGRQPFSDGFYGNGIRWGYFFIIIICFCECVKTVLYTKM